MATSAAFARIVSLSSILEAATWSSSTVFTSFYLRDIQFSSSNRFSLGLVVAAGAVVLYIVWFVGFSFKVYLQMEASAW